MIYHVWPIGIALDRLFRGHVAPSAVQLRGMKALSRNGYTIKQ